MSVDDLSPETLVVVLCAGLVLLWALLLGVQKYNQMSRSPDASAHPYVDIGTAAPIGDSWG